MSTKFLDYELALLLAKYGRKAVVTALSQKLNLSLEQLEATLRDLDSEETPSHRATKARNVPKIETLVAQYPEKAEPLQVLTERFQCESFLPELRDVRRFFEQYSRNLGHVKSRAASYPKLIRLLADLDVSELNAVCQSSQVGQYSSLGILSDEILRRRK
ncbi:MAG: hypothetical protein HY315_09900 [Acidobacteria bacterium]|nr:hypothetical protein [Acidobacteriota bacterium]